MATGFDLFVTTYAGLVYDPVGPKIANFEGNPTAIGTAQGCGPYEFDFEDGNGCTYTDHTDTIVHRLQEATDVSGMIDIQMVALSLISTTPYDFFGIEELIGARILQDLSTGTYIYGGDNGSTMEILFEPDGQSGTWSATLDLTIEVYGLSSGLSFDVDKLFSTSGVPWTRTSIGLNLEGINFLLNGQDTSEDFFSGLAVHDDGSGTVHIVVPAPIPVPAGLALMATALGGLGLLRRKKRYS